MARPIAKDRDEKRQTILKTAAHVFAQHGITRSAMSKVAQACSISKGKIYYYYDSKEALVFDILDTYLHALTERIGNLDYSNRTPDKQLELFCQETLLAYEGMDDEHKIQTEGLTLLPVEQQKILKNHQRELVAILNAILLQLSPDTFGNAEKLREATMSVFGMLNWFYMWNPKADKKSRLTYGKTVASLTKDGVRGLSTQENGVC